MENDTKAPQKKKGKGVSLILAAFAGLLIIVELQQPNFGFSLIEIGRSFWALLIYAVGGKLIFDAYGAFFGRAKE